MAGVQFSGVGKVYPDGTRAVEDLNLEINDGDFMVFVGPSGCGKTTALRMVAGLEEITEGELRIGEDVVNSMEPRKRDVAMVFQNYALYPHMSIFDNIAFPLRSRRLPKTEIRQRVERAANLLGLEDMLKRRPRTLSGGQRQRVAMGRAIVREPQVFLMDEPLSNLDAKLRVQMRAEISKLQKDLGVTTIYVTHDQVEAMTMGTRIAVMRKGVLQQTGPAQQLYDEPSNLFVATFIGSPAMTLFRVRVERRDDEIRIALGDQEVVLSPPASTRYAALSSYDGGEVALGIRPEDMREPSADNAANPRIRGEVRLVEALGSERLVHFELAAEPVLTDALLEIAKDIDAAAVQALEQEAEAHMVMVVARFDGRSTARVGEIVEVAVDPAHLHFFDLADGAAIR